MLNGFNGGGEGRLKDIISLHNSSLIKAKESSNADCVCPYGGR